MLSVFERLSKLTIPAEIVVVDSLGFCAALFRSRTSLTGENLFLGKQLALFQEREKKATRITATDRSVCLNWLASSAMVSARKKLSGVLHFE